MAGTNRCMQRWLLAASAICGVAGLTSPALALPAGGQITAGQASISVGQKSLDITQSSSRVVIDWSSFDIGGDEAVRFRQPSASSIALNRIHDSQPSSIDGSLSANGQVWLLNPNGILFGSGAQVNVAGLVATTANIANSDFMSGNYAFTSGGNPTASIANAGTITVAQAGLAALVAPQVSNSGTITARVGRVQLASGDRFGVDLYGDGLINLGVSNTFARQLVSNSGRIQADGGQVQLTAAAASGAVSSVINMDGIIQARTIGDLTGEVELYAEGSSAVPSNNPALKGQKSGSSTVLVSGTLDASGKGSGQSGGSISVLGDDVGILSGAKIDASGDAGGGYIKIGGDFHGQRSTPTAVATVVQSGSAISADAVTSGKGGNVAVWSDNYTNFAGSIFARGGSLSGSGGFVETSGKQVLDMSGLVDASAPHGLPGTWLMDPNNLIVNGSATSNAGSSPSWTAGSGGGNVLNTDIDAALNAGTSVDLTASGSIEFAASISKTAGGDATLTASAGTDISVDGGISIGSTTGKLNVVFDSDTANGGGAIAMNAGSRITTNGGDMYLGGGSLDANGHPTGAAVGDASNITGVTVDGQIQAGGGNISISGDGYTGTSSPGALGILIGNNVQTTGNGTISLTGVGGSFAPTVSSYWDQGVQISGLVSSVNGNITVHGTAPLYFGVWIIDGQVESTGTGNINVFGSSNQYQGMYLSGGSLVSTNTGTITLTGYGGLDPVGAGNTGIAMDGYGGPTVATVESTSGNIVISGTGGNYSGGVNIGFYSSGTVQAGGNGTISITGTGGSGGNGDYGIYLNSGTVKTANGALTLTGTSGDGGDADIYVASGSHVGGGSEAGTITLAAESLSLASNTFQTTGTVAFIPRVASSTIGVEGGAGTLGIDSTALASIISAGGITIGATSDTGLMTVDTHTWTTPLALLSGSGSIAINGTQTMGGNGFLADTASGGITIGASGGVTSTASGTAITLADSGGDFINQAGSGALSASSGRWLIYSTNPADNTLDGLTSAFYRYSCTYGGTCPSFPAVGNGLLYSSAFSTSVPSSVEIADSAGGMALSLADLLTPGVADDGRSPSRLSLAYCKMVNGVNVCFPM